MPSPAPPGANQFRCEACGRHFNSAEELSRHAVECEGAKQSQVNREKPNSGAEHDREWESTP